MAIALEPTRKRRHPSRVEWRGIAAILALAVILVGIALSGGLELSQPAPAVESLGAAGAGPQGPVYDGRGKWTGY